MTMQVTVLGGSGASVGTGQGCSGYLVSSSTTRLVLDLGPGTLPELRKHTDFRTLDGIVLSHLHVDHMADLLALRFSLAYNPIRPDRRTPLWLPPGGMAMLDRLGGIFSGDEPAERFFHGVFDLAEYDPNATLTIGDLTVTFLPTVHYVPCWAIRVDPVGGGGICYTADTGPRAEIGTFAKGASVLLAEATLLESEAESVPADTRGHLTAREAAAFASQAGVSTLILTHAYEERDPANAAAVVASELPIRVERAVPGLQVTW